MALTSSKQVQVRMRRQHPKPIMLPPKRLHRRPLGHIPHPDRLILPIRQDQLVPRVEETHRDVVEVSAAGVDFPGFGIGHAPEFDLAVVAAGDDEGEGGVEGGPVDASVVL